MAGLSNSPSGQAPSVPKTIEIIPPSKSEKKIEEVLVEVDRIFDSPEAQIALGEEEKEVVYEYIKKNLAPLLIRKQPGDFAKVIKQVDARYQERLKKIGIGNFEKRDIAIETYTKFLKDIGNTIDKEAQNIFWQTEGITLKQGYENKKKSLIATYKNILNSLSNEVKK